MKVNEITRAVERSRAAARRPGLQEKPAAPVRPWPRTNEEQREAVAASNLGLVDLWEMSPVRFGDETPRTEEIIDALFPGNHLLCVGESSYSFQTRPREDWRGQLSAAQLIVPSPMSAPSGRTQDGKVSPHCLANTGPRRFLVIEQDTGSADEQAAILLHLAERAPLALAVHSGSKSIHGWFFAAYEPE